MTLWMIAIIAVAFASDQTSKFIVSRYLDPHASIDVIPSFFQLSLVHNHGAAFGILSGVEEPVRSIALISLSVAAFAILIYLYMQRPAGDRLVACSIALISGGAIGNLTDRIRLGYVVDFLDVYVRSYHWPTFNVADSCITIGMLLIMASMWREGRPRHAP